jgi:BlaI family transcriptional regulator, penicillinase repressor
VPIGSDTKILQSQKICPRRPGDLHIVLHMQNNLHIPLDNRFASMQNYLQVRSPILEPAQKKDYLMPRFTAGELEVMRILWEHGEMKPAEIQAIFPRTIKNAALRSYLSILHAKGHLSRRRKGNAFFYRPKTKRESTFRSLLADLVNTFCGGSTEALLCQLIAKEKISEKELLALREMAQEQSSSQNSTRRGQS